MAGYPADLLSGATLLLLGAGLEMPDIIKLRKQRRIEADMEGGETPSLPYQVDISYYQDVLRRIFGGRRNTKPAIPGRYFKLSEHIKADMW